MSHDAPRRTVMLGLAGLTGAGVSALALGQDRRPSALPMVKDAQAAVDPRAFGARVDATADDSAALAAAAATKRPIFFTGALRIDQTVDLPGEIVLSGGGVHRSRIVLGPRGRLRIAGQSFDRRTGGTVIRDLTISPVGGATRYPGLEVTHAEHMLFENVNFYRAGVILDEHHYLTFSDCRFYGEGDKVTVASNCVSQPRGKAAISEMVSFDRCFFSSCPVTLEDTVDARFTNCVMFAGPFGIRSIRRLSAGRDLEPFFMGPTLSGCVLDSIDGIGLDIDGGGTDCRIVNTFISSGRSGKAPGVRLAGCSAVDLVANRFEWCGSAGLLLDRCERIGLIGNTFGNIASGPAVAARATRDVRVVGNAFENRLRWGGSAEGFTTLAIDADQGCTGWVVTGNTAAGLRDPRVARLGGGIVQHNQGWPAATEQGWPAGASEARPQGVADGYRWYDQTLGLWLHWHAGSRRWRDPMGRAV